MKILLLALALSSAAAIPQPPPPALTAPVNDFAGVIDADSKRELERRIRSLQEASGDAVVIATVKTYKPDYADIREYAVKMFENHGRGIGDRGKDGGVLIVLAVDDRQMGIEVGYGLEGAIPDGYAGQIRDMMRDDFRAGAYGRGLLKGTTTLINRIAEERGISLQDVPRQQRPRQVTVPVSMDWVRCAGLLIFVILFLVLSSRGGRRRRRRWGRGPWSGWNSGVGPFGGTIGGFGGGFGGFGGGGSGGGGFGGSGGFGGFGGGRSGGGGAAGGW
jgi:uncharacterized protein